ncbi:MAG: glycosyl hydrolase family 95 catalytic domain-containing protein [Verrucomicrobiales bacterium]
MIERLVFTAGISLFGLVNSLALSLPVPDRGFISTRPASTWEEGLICGNGTLGMNLLSRPLDERIIFTHERLFMPMGRPHVPPDQSKHLSEIRSLIAAGRYKEAEKRQFELSKQKGFMYPDFFVPAFDLTIRSEAKGEIRGYARSVDFEKAEATVRWEDDRGAFVRRAFVSREDGVAAVLLSASELGQIDCRLKLEAREPSNELNDDSDINVRSDENFRVHFGDLESHSTVDSLGFSARFLRSYPGSIQSVRGSARVVATGGWAEAHDDGSLSIRGADQVLLLVDVQLIKDEEPSFRLESLEVDYEVLLSRHVLRHGELFRRVKLDLGGGDDHRSTTEQLMEDSTFERMNLAWFEKQFDAGRYNIICSTGELPPNLQGVWGGTYVPGWASDFTHNGNVPSAISSLLMGNTPELMLAYIDYIESLIPDLKVNARHFYGARGVVLPSRTSTHGYNNAFAENFAGGMWVTGAAWAAHFFYDYYLYTGDESFLRDRALPFLEQVGLFFEDYLYEGADGKFIFSPTQSPENWPAGSESQATFNATADVAAAKELFSHLIEASKILKVHADQIPRWEEMLRKMPDYQVAENGIIKEWLTPELGNNDAHRHSSQLYPLYDGLPAEIDQSPELRSAFMKSVEDKLERYWKDNERGFMSFGIVQLGQVAASLGYGEIAHLCLEHLVDGFWLNNLASMHNRRALFNMDISGGQPCVVMKMLVASERGRMRVLPALPRAWSKGSIEGVLCRGAIRVERLSWDNERVDLTLVSTVKQELEVVMPRAIRELTVRDVRKEVDDDSIRLTLPAGQAVRMSALLAVE